MHLKKTYDTDIPRLPTQFHNRNRLQEATVNLKCRGKKKIGFFFFKVFEATEILSVYAKEHAEMICIAIQSIRTSVISSITRFLITFFH